LQKIQALCAALPYPVIVKEVGWGLSARVALGLKAAGVAALDIAGSGGTSWSQVERHRLESSADREVAAAFADWGIPTAEGLQAVRDCCPELPLIASGGIHTGVDAAKCLALGADLVGMARKLLGAAVESDAALYQQMQILLEQLRIAMFCTGAQKVEDLTRARITRRYRL
jgi:isopentenyl-diphosphate delta-isomerase